jgi:hypothetical protein
VRCTAAAGLPPREGELIVVQPERDTERISSGRAANRGRDQRGVEVVRTIMAAPPVREMRARLEA